MAHILLSWFIFAAFFAFSGVPLPRKPFEDGLIRDCLLIVESFTN
jgi:hypothetical protein